MVSSLSLVKSSWVIYYTFLLKGDCFVILSKVFKMSSDKVESSLFFVKFLTSSNIIKVKSSNITAKLPPLFSYYLICFSYFSIRFMEKLKNIQLTYAFVHCCCLRLSAFRVSFYLFRLFCAVNGAKPKIILIGRQTINLVGVKVFHFFVKHDKNLIFDRLRLLFCLICCWTRHTTSCHQL